MVRLQQRRTRLLAIAIFLACFLSYACYGRDSRDVVTWQVSSTTTTRAPVDQVLQSTEILLSEKIPKARHSKAVQDVLPSSKPTEILLQEKAPHVQNSKETETPLPRSKPSETLLPEKVPQVQLFRPTEIILPESLAKAPIATLSSKVTMPVHPTVYDLSTMPTMPPSSATNGSLTTAPSMRIPPMSLTPSNFTVPTCIGYEQLQMSHREPLSAGKRQFPYSRPLPECRTFNLSSMETLIERMNDTVKDPDLFRLFENSYPNTLDTMIKWRGYAVETDPVTMNETVTDQELTYVITGDIDAMWLRDSASQVNSYLPLLVASSESESLASLWRGLINIQARYIVISPYCHSFQPPAESGIPPTKNGAYHNNHPNPAYNPNLVFDCKWELDSLASFLQISTAYYQRTNDLAFFDRYSWVSAVEAAVDAAGAMRVGTYSKEGKVEKSAWTFTGWTNRGSETLTNDGLGNPTKENGMVRTAFRPSDDACIYQFLVPANMMWAKYLEEASFIMEKLDDAKAENLTTVMRDFAYGIRRGIDRDAIVHHRDFGDIFAYEVDGYGGQNLMDDGEKAHDMMQEEVNGQLQMVLDSTTGKGVVHESVNAWNEYDWSRAWFGWANGLLGELILKLAERDEAAGESGDRWFAQSFQ
ncbi:Meiotically up-regulated [Hyphodiscus hymeniophilus]|uniref:Meiotically up-regulated n=1 Tax=Hyphodiscus hymeniophilus TaxID=353542 RepID=A0A9P6VMP1_9HELO|nr:Meiotically up-regulated [Hyphodiscus hymeniophilus]